MPREFDIIVSNPPYISVEEMKNLIPEVREFEPNSALTDQHDGLSFYKHIFKLIKEENTLYTNFLLLEISGTQCEAIHSLALQFSFENIQIRNDYNNIPRVLIIKV